MNSISRILRVNRNKLQCCGSVRVGPRMSWSMVDTTTAENLVQQRCFTSLPNNASNALLRAPAVAFVPSRTKSNKKKSGGRKQDFENEDEDEDKDELIEYSDTGTRDKNVIQFKSTSLRADLIIKSALSISRNKIEEHFYDSRIRINGQKIQKKSVTVKLNDEIDVVKSYCPLNPLNIIVARIEILNTAVRDEKIIITARRHKNYTIDNYEGSNAFKSNL